MSKTSSKSGKAVSSLDAVNVSLVKDFQAVLNFSGEVNVFEKALGMLKAGTISVRGLKATIEQASEAGSLPTIKASHAQYFLQAEQVRALSGGKDKALKDVLNATIQAKREFGKEFDKAIEGATSFADLVAKTPKQGEKAKAGRKASSTEPLANMDAYISLFLGAKDLADIRPTNEAQWVEFLAFVKAISSSIKASHPAGKGLANVG